MHYKAAVLSLLTSCVASSQDARWVPMSLAGGKNPPATTTTTIRPQVFGGTAASAPSVIQGGEITVGAVRSSQALTVVIPMVNDSYGQMLIPNSGNLGYSRVSVHLPGNGVLIGSGQDAKIQISIDTRAMRGPQEITVLVPCVLLASGERVDSPWKIKFKVEGGIVPEPTQMTCTIKSGVLEGCPEGVGFVFQGDADLLVDNIYVEDPDAPFTVEFTPLPNGTVRGLLKVNKDKAAVYRPGHHSTTNLRLRRVGGEDSWIQVDYDIAD